tara:strand:- start:5704 stop:6729 length:1026 start_codon:yes stop_codon:yes gene_type:complete
MAYSFGAGVRPELGKTDYSGYLQGALTGAQGVAAGGAAIGQGIANAGAGIGEGIKKYQQNKVLQAEIMGGVEENIDFLTKNNPNFIKEAPPEVQKIMGRMASGKGVSVSQSAYLKSWSDSTTKKTKVDIDKNAFLQSITPVDGKDPTGNESAFRYFQLGGTDRNAITTLLALADEPVNAQLRNLKVTEATQNITGITPITLFQERQLKNQENEIAARTASSNADRIFKYYSEGRKLKAGDKQTLVIEGKDVPAVWDGNDWMFESSGKQIWYEPKVDFLGNVVGQQQLSAMGLGVATADPNDPLGDGAGAQPLNETQLQAKAWAEANPKDPRAKRILQSLGF